MQIIDAENARFLSPFMKHSNIILRPANGQQWAAAIDWSSQFRIVLITTPY